MSEQTRSKYPIPNLNFGLELKDILATASVSYRFLMDILDQNLTSNIKPLCDTFLTSAAQLHLYIHPDESISQTSSTLTLIFNPKKFQVKIDPNNAAPSPTTPLQPISVPRTKDEARALPPRILQPRATDLLEGAISNGFDFKEFKRVYRNFGAGFVSVVCYF